MASEREQRLEEALREAREVIEKLYQFGDWDDGVDGPEGQNHGIIRTAQYVGAITSKIDAALATPATPSEGWQPIETAPRDATYIVLFYIDRYGNECREVGHWAEGGGEEQPPFGPAWFLRAGESGFAELNYKPSHWMPLPPAPAQAAPREQP